MELRHPGNYCGFVSLISQAGDKQRALQMFWRRVRQVSRWQWVDSASDLTANGAFLAPHL